MLTSLSSCRHRGRSIFSAHVAAEPQRSLAYPHATFGELHAITWDGVAAPNSPTPGDSLKTPSCRRRDCVTSPAGVIRIGAGERMDVMTNPNTTTRANLRKRMCAHISCLYIAPDGEESRLSRCEKRRCGNHVSMRSRCLFTLDPTVWSRQC